MCLLRLRMFASQCPTAHCSRVRLSQSAELCPLLLLGGVSVPNHLKSANPGNVIRYCELSRLSVHLAWVLCPFDFFARAFLVQQHAADSGAAALHSHHYDTMHCHGVTSVWRKTLIFLRTAVTCAGPACDRLSVTRPGPCVCVHTHTHTHTRARAHTHTHTAICVASTLAIRLCSRRTGQCCAPWVVIMDWEKLMCCSLSGSDFCKRSRKSRKILKGQKDLERPEINGLLPAPAARRTAGQGGVKGFIEVIVHTVCV